MTDVAPDPAATPPSSAKLVNLPNALTVLRLAVVPVFAVLLLQDGGLDDAGRYWATLVFALAIITDRYDGMIARRTGQVTEFGKLADPIADKALTGTALIGLSVLGLLPWWVTVVILVREVGVTVLRFWVIRHGVIAASRGGKAKTVVQALAIGLTSCRWTGWLASARWWVMAAAVVLTVRHRRSTTSTARSPCARPARGPCGPPPRGGRPGRAGPAAPAPTPPPERSSRRPSARATAVSSGARLHPDLAAQDAAEGVVLAPGGDPVAGRLVGLDQRPLTALPERLGQHRDVHRLDRGGRPARPAEQPAQLLQRVQQAQLQPLADGQDPVVVPAGQQLQLGDRAGVDAQVPGRRGCGPARGWPTPPAGPGRPRRRRARPSHDCSAVTRGQPTCCSRHSAERRLPAARQSSTSGHSTPAATRRSTPPGCSAR